MNFSDESLVVLVIALALPMAVLAALNWIFRKRGGVAKGWAGAVFIGICWVAAMVIIIQRVS
ncbi:MAG: hypothetical protein P4L92_11015 [Rudaea sp.]|nr:hypothetical protein [Rudaea sp.]